MYAGGMERSLGFVAVQPRNGTITIPAEARRALRRGRRSGRFEYRVLLPGQAEADKVTAALADGVLTVTVPKAEADKPHRIQVTVA